MDAALSTLELAETAAAAFHAAPGCADPMFQIVTGTPVRDMNGFGFEIRLWPAWKDLVAEWPYGQPEVNRAIESLGNGWLDACGYDKMYDPDQNPLDEWEAERTGKVLKLGPSARRLYDARTAIRVLWGEWGPEHISVPGNACGLDIYSGIYSPKGGITLSPHNIDCMRQAFLLMLVFNWFADTMLLERRCKRHNHRAQRQPGRNSTLNA